MAGRRSGTTGPVSGAEPTIESERALGRRYGRAFDLHRVAQRPGDALERRFDDVVPVAARQRSDVQRDPRTERERAPELLGELRVERADELGDRVDLVHQEGTTRQVERDLDECLVERHERRGKATHARLVAQCVLQRGAEHDADVLDGVVEVDVEVALRLDAETEAGVLAQLFEHVVEERDAGRRGGAAPTVDVEHEIDGRLLRAAMLFRRAWAHPATSWTVLRRALRK